MENKNKKQVNLGWLLSLAAWILSSIFIPFLPEIIRFQTSNLFGYPLMEYVATIGLFAAIFLLVWIPIGIKAGKIYKTQGLNKVLVLVAISFILLVLFWVLVFMFIWNS